MTTVVLADASPLLLEGLRATLTRVGLSVVGATDDGATVLELVESAQPDVVLLDLDLPDRSGLDRLAALRELAPGVRVIVLSDADEPDAVDAALALGAVCFVGKAVAPEDLAAAVKLCASGAPVYTVASSRPEPPRADALAHDSFPGAAASDLTVRELEVLRLMAEGMSNGEIGRTLWVTEQTVKFHLSNIYRKLEVANRTQAAARARSLGLTTDRDAPGDARRRRRELLGSR